MPFIHPHSHAALRAIGNQPTIRTAEALIDELLRNGPATESEMAKRTGIRRPRVVTLFERMLDVGWIEIRTDGRFHIAMAPPW